MGAGISAPAFPLVWQAFYPPSHSSSPRDFNILAAIEDDPPLQPSEM